MRIYLRYRRLLDLVFAAVTGSVLFALDRHSVGEIQPVSPEAPALLTLASISMTLLGFALTSSTFLVANLRSERFKVLKSSKHASNLSAILSSTFWRLLVLSIASILGYVFWPIPVEIIVYAISSFAVYTLLAVMTLIWTVSAILRIEFGNP